MRLWADGKAGGAGSAVRAAVKEQVTDINRQVRSRGRSAVEVMRTAERKVLHGQRSGRVYKKPGTNGKASKATRELRGDYGHNLRGGQLYRASAPGEPPARRTGMLRLGWTDDVKTRNTSKGTEVIAALESTEKYAALLENGTSKMAPRPFVEKIKEEAMPEIRRIYGESYT